MVTLKTFERFGRFLRTQAVEGNFGVK